MLAPRHRVDVALPSDVPVAELVPMVLELVGEPGRAVAPQPWRLSGIVGGPLPAAATLGELGVLDGELLRLGPALPVPAAPVFDDPVDAVAAGAATGARGHRFEVAAVLALAVAAAVLLGAAGPGSAPAALLACAGAVVAVAGAGRLAQATRGRAVGQRGDAGAGAGSGRLTHCGEPGFARGVGLAGVVLAAAAGWAAVPGPPGPVPLLAAAVAAGIAAAAAQLLLRVVAPALVAAGVIAIVGAAAVIGVQFGATPVAAATGVAALAVVAAPLLPRAAIRLAGLPRPVVPADEAELTGDDAHRYRPPSSPSAPTSPAATSPGWSGRQPCSPRAGAVVAAAAGGWAGPAFAGVTAAVLLLRARGYADAAPARTALTVGLADGGRPGRHGSQPGRAAEAGRLRGPAGRGGGGRRRARRHRARDATRAVARRAAHGRPAGGRAGRRGRALGAGGDGPVRSWYARGDAVAGAAARSTGGGT